MLSDHHLTDNNNNQLPSSIRPPNKRIAFILLTIKYLFATPMDDKELTLIKKTLNGLTSSDSNIMAPLWTREQIKALTKEEKFDISLSRKLFFYTLLPSESELKFLLSNIDQVSPIRLRKILFGAPDNNKKIGNNALLFSVLAKNGYLDIIQMLFKHLTEEEIKTILIARSLEITSPTAEGEARTSKINYQLTLVWRTAKNGHRETVDYLLQQHSFGPAADGYFRLVSELSKKTMDIEALNPLLESYVRLEDGVKRTLPPISALTSMIYMSDLKTIEYALDKNLIPKTGEPLTPGMGERDQSSFFTFVLHYEDISAERRLALIELFLKKAFLTSPNIEDLFYYHFRIISENENIFSLVMDNVISSFSSSLFPKQKIPNVAYHFSQMSCPSLSSAQLNELFKKAGNLLNEEDKNQFIDYHATRKAMMKAIQENNLEALKNVDLSKLSATEIMYFAILTEQLEFVNYCLSYLISHDHHLDVFRWFPGSEISLLRLCVGAHIDIPILQSLIKHDINLYTGNFSHRLLSYVGFLGRYLSVHNIHPDIVGTISDILIQHCENKQIKPDIFKRIPCKDRPPTFLLEETVKLPNFKLAEFFIKQNVKANAADFNFQLLRYIIFLRPDKKIQPDMVDTILKTLAQQCVNEKAQFNIFFPILLPGGRSVSLLEEAIKLGNSKVIEFLVKLDIKINSKEEKISQQQLEHYWYIVKNNMHCFTTIMPILKNNCVNWADCKASFINRKENHMDGTLLHMAISQASCNKENALLLEIIKIMVEEYGANVNAEKAGSYTPLHGIIIAKNVDIHVKIKMIELFLKHGAKSNELQKNEETLLFAAVRHSSNDIDGKIEIIKLLLGSGADINKPRADGETPLFAAIRLSSQEDAVRICWLLIKKGADVTVKNNEGLTVLDKIREMNKRELAGFFQKAQFNQIKFQQFQTAPSLNPSYIGVIAPDTSTQTTLSVPSNIVTMQQNEDTRASKRKESPKNPAFASSSSPAFFSSKKIKLNEEKEEEKMQIDSIGESKKDTPQPM